MVNIIFFRKMIRKVVTSNFCPYNQDHNHPVKCNCRENCSKNDRCNLTHHAEMEGSFKKVIYGVIGPDDFVKNVHAKMKQINYNGGVYTLMMNTQGPINEDNTYDIINEIRTLEKLREVDPQGNFTPILLFYDKVDARDLARAPTANFSVGYSKSLTVGVKKKKIISLCHVAHELTNRTYGEKKWWVVIVKDQ